MEKRLLGKTGLAVSPLGFGGGPVGYLGEDAQRTAHILDPLLDAGVNLIDTAACYPGSEPLIAEAIGRRRDEYILVSKCGHKVDGVRGKEWSAQLIGLSVERSLKRLKTDHIDVMLLHSCNLEMLKRGEAISALARARESGKIRFFGYSGDNDAAAYAATLEDIAVIETSVNICDQVNIDLVLSRTVEKNIGVLAKRPMANAAWKDPSEQRGIYQSYVQSYTERLSAMRITPADLGFNGNPTQLWPHIALRFTLSSSRCSLRHRRDNQPKECPGKPCCRSRRPLACGYFAKDPQRLPVGTGKHRQTLAGPDRSPLLRGVSGKAGRGVVPSPGKGGVG